MAKKKSATKKTAKKKLPMVLDSVPAGVEAISTRMAAEIIGCSMGHLRKMLSRGEGIGRGKRGVDWFLISPRALVWRRKTVERYAAREAGTGRPRGGFAIDR
jgi:hypothetical protein